MNWQTKARIQSIVSKMPDQLSYSVYYQLQRRFGGHRPSRIDPTSRMQFGIDICRQIVAQGRSPIGATFFEVGTGWRLNLPIACWLLGADRITTVDLNRYLKLELIREDLLYLHNHADTVATMLREQLPECFDEHRWEMLLGMEVDDADRFCHMLGVEYLAPGDAATTHLAAESVDFHVSCNVLEHIPRDVLASIMREANRIVRQDGLLVHRVDHTDHFSHGDNSISPVNFLQYEDAEWQQMADNRYGYVNRLREDDYLALFDEAGQIVREIDSHVSDSVQEELMSGFPLNTRFRNKSLDTLSRLTSLFVVSPRSALHAQLA